MGLAGPRHVAVEAIATSAVVVQAEATAMSAAVALEVATAMGAVADLEVEEIVLNVAAALVAGIVSSAMALRGIAATGLIPRVDPADGLTALLVITALIVVVARIAPTAVAVQLPVMAAPKATSSANRKPKA